MKKFKLKTKMFLGFLAIILLLCVVAAGGFFGLGSVSSRVSGLDKVSEIATLIGSARQQEKDYMLRRMADFASETNLLADKLKIRAQEAKKAFQRESDRKQMDQVAKEVGEYQAAFNGFVALDQKRASRMRDMEAKAEAAIGHLKAVQEGQAVLLSTGRDEAAAQLTANMSHLAAANRLINMMTEARIHQAQLMSMNTAAAMKAWEEINDKVLGLSKDLTGKFKDPANQAVVQKAADLYKQYIASFKQYLNSREFKDRQKMAKDSEDSQLQMSQVLAIQNNQMTNAQSAADEMVSSRFNNASQAGRLTQLFADVRKAEKEFILSNGDPAWRDKAQKFLTEMAALADQLKGRLKAPEEVAKVDQFKTAAAQYQQAFQAYAGLMQQQREAEGQMLKAAQEVEKICMASLTGQKSAMGEDMEWARYLIAAFSLAGIVIGLLLSWLITRSITTPINRVIAGLSQGADQVTSAASQVSDSSQSLAEGASQQAASLEETSSSLEEMASMTKQNSDNAEQADRLTNQAADVVSRANQAMGDLTHSMSDIRKTSEETAGIVKTIDEIAFQTNLLALNAAVEAARAGEAGAGFAVVAEEVRNLAMRAAEAAKNTSALIEQSVSNIKKGGEIVSRTNEAFGEVSQTTNKVSELVSEIAAASREQSTGIDQVNRAVGDMDKVTQQNAASAEQSAAAAQQMSSQAAMMQDYVQNLVDLVGYQKSTGEKKTRRKKAARKELAAPAKGFLPAGGKAARPSRDAKAAPSKKEPRPEDVLPLDDDEDFKDF